MLTKTSRDFTSLVFIWRHLMINVSRWAWYDNLYPFKIYDFWLSAWQADNQLEGKRELQMQTLGYHGK